MMCQSNTTKFYYVYYCIRATCFDSYRIIFRPSVRICFLVRPEDNSISIETCRPNTIIDIIKLCCVWLIHHCIFIYVWRELWRNHRNTFAYKVNMDRDSSVDIATRYRLGGPRIEFRWWRDFSHKSRSALRPIQCLCSEYRVFFQEGKTAGTLRWTPTPI